MISSKGASSLLGGGKKNKIQPINPQISFLAYLQGLIVLPEPLFVRLLNLNDNLLRPRTNLKLLPRSIFNSGDQLISSLLDQLLESSPPRIILHLIKIIATYSVQNNFILLQNQRISQQMPTRAPVNNLRHHGLHSQLLIRVYNIAQVPLIRIEEDVVILW